MLGIDPAQGAVFNRAIEVEVGSRLQRVQKRRLTGKQHIGYALLGKLRPPVSLLNRLADTERNLQIVWLPLKGIFHDVMRAGRRVGRKEAIHGDAVLVTVLVLKLPVT